MAVVEAVHGHKVRSRVCSSVRTFSMFNRVWCRTLRVCLALRSGGPAGRLGRVRRPGGSRRDSGQGCVGVPQLWGAFRHPEGSGLCQAQRHPLRDNTIASDRAQTAVALQGTAVPPGLLHGVATRGPGTFEADHTVSGRAGVRGCRTAAMRVRGRDALRRHYLQ